MSTTTYPVHVDADLDPRMSRWLWLVKWVLVIPHYIVLVFLWLAFAVLSVVAFFGILFTGRYPRSIFEFNVGVLRWSWRVAYYAYGALGTDRYPPFTLHDVPDYPAHLEVEYPEHLSRGLVLVKWWLLAIPHYIVVGLLVGGAGYAVRAGSDQHAVWGSGLIGILVLVAGIILLFTGRYPQRLFDLVLGLNRWVLRVAGYAGLMTDKYPPFSLDQGGHEDQGGTTTILPPAPAGPADPPTPSTVPPTSSGAPPTRPAPWTGGRVVSLVLGSLLVLVSIGLGLPGTALVAADIGARDSDGFLMSARQPIATTSYALVSDSLQLHVDAPPALTPSAILGDTKVSATPRGRGEVFIGIAPTSAVDTYLADVRHAKLTDIKRGAAVLEVQPGQAPAVAPTQLNIWTEQSTGPNTQSIIWKPRNGDWTVVVMNADGSARVSVDTRAGAEVPALPWLIAGLLILAAVSLLAGVVLIAVPLRAVSKQQTSSRSQSQ